MRKYKKTIRTGGGFKQCFNDVPGFRLRLAQYPEEFLDYLFNIWSHRYIYKYKDAEIGKLLYEEYAEKIICSEQDFVERLKFWEGEMNGR